MQDSLWEANRDSYRQGAGADRKAEPGLTQQPNSSLEADLVMDIVNYLSKFGEIYFVLNKFMIRKKKDPMIL